MVEFPVDPQVSHELLYSYQLRSQRARCYSVVRRRGNTRRRNSRLEDNYDMDIFSQETPAMHVSLMVYNIPRRGKWR